VKAAIIRVIIDVFAHVDGMELQAKGDPVEI
jgi:hypothetical protein